MRSLIVAVGRYSASPADPAVDGFADGEGTEEQAPIMSNKEQDKTSEGDVLIKDLGLAGVKHRSKVRTYNVHPRLEKKKSAQSF
jgi:hypothetical protein